MNNNLSFDSKLPPASLPTGIAYSNIEDASRAFLFEFLFLFILIVIFNLQPPRHATMFHVSPAPDAKFVRLAPVTLQLGGCPTFICSVLPLCHPPLC